MQINYFTIILTSAVISALISGIFLIWSDWLRRKSEEKRLILEIAIKLTKFRDEQIGEILKRTNKKVLWPAPLNTFEKTVKEVFRIWSGKSKKNYKPPLKT